MPSKFCGFDGRLLAAKPVFSPPAAWIYAHAVRLALVVPHCANTGHARQHCPAYVQKASLTKVP